MIPASPYERGGIVPLPAVVKNHRGFIQNLVEHPVGGVGVITTFPRCIRGQHLHRTDWHYLYVVQGGFWYFERSEGSERPIDNPVWVGERQMCFTPPGVEHAQFFPRGNTILISASRLPRDHESHEADLVRLEGSIICPQWLSEWFQKDGHVVHHQV